MYNHEPFLRQCLDGFVMQQTNFPFEAIVHDDASTDGSAAIIREYAEKYPDIIKPIIETENQYSKHDGSIRRIMDAHTRGKYVAYCEGDDYWTDPLKLQKQVDFLESHPDYSMCAHRAQVVYEGVPTIDYEWFSKLNDCEMPIEIGLFPPVFPTASIVIRADVAKLAPVHKDFHAGDIIIHASAYARGRVYGMRESMSVYRKHLQAWSYNNKLKKNYQILSIPHFLAMMEKFPQKIRKVYKEKTAFACYLWLRNYREYTGLLSLKYLLKAIYYCNMDLLRFIICQPLYKLLRKMGINIACIEP